ncbi:hypothetical protein CLOP_g16064 [Closterium sp. NIES-67]|nr:hypothetical protein CLOP_g16064 [Closterium sp. NIES-67]
MPRHSACCLSLSAHLMTTLLVPLVLALTRASLRADAAILDLVTAAGAGSQGFGYTGKATATYYGGGIDGGNCGYGNLLAAGYGPIFAAGSVMLYKDGRGCGSCYRVRCVDSPYCKKGVSGVTVAITDQCPAGGGWCCPTCVHFDLGMAAFNMIAEQVAGHVPLVYTRVPCLFNRNIRLTPTGSDYWINLLVRNVAGPGDLASIDVAEAGSAMWKPMTHDWGAVWVYRTYLKSPLRFRLTSLMDGQVVETPAACLPAGWVAGKDYDCQVQFSSGGGGGGWNNTGGNNGLTGGGGSEGNSGTANPPGGFKLPLPPKTAPGPPRKTPPPAGKPKDGTKTPSPPGTSPPAVGKPHNGTRTPSPKAPNSKAPSPKTPNPKTPSPKTPSPKTPSPKTPSPKTPSPPKKSPLPSGKPVKPKNGTKTTGPPKKSPPSTGKPKNGTKTTKPQRRVHCSQGAPRMGPRHPAPQRRGHRPPRSQRL